MIIRGLIELDTDIVRPEQLEHLLMLQLCRLQEDLRAEYEKHVPPPNETTR